METEINWVKRKMETETVDSPKVETVAIDIKAVEAVYRIVVDGLHAMKRGSYKGDDALPIAQLMNFLQNTKADAEARMKNK